MLLRSKTALLCTVSMVLHFDDSAEKEVTFKENDYILIKSRYNGNKFVDVAKVNKVLPIFDSIGKFEGCKLVLDLAKQFNSNRITINTNDILNVKPITKEAAMDLYNCGDDLVITDEMFNPDPVEDIDPDMGVTPDDPTVEEPDEDTPPTDTPAEDDPEQTPKDDDPVEDINPDMGVTPDEKDNDDKEEPSEELPSESEQLPEDDSKDDEDQGVEKDPTDKGGEELDGDN